MLGLLFHVTSFLFFFSIVLNGLSWIRLWETRDYQLRRVLIHLKDTNSGRNILFGPTSSIKWFLILSYSVTIFINGFDAYYHLLVFLFYLLVMSDYIRKVYLRIYLLPTMSIYVIVICGIAVIFEVLLFIFSPLDRYFWILILDKSFPLIIALLIGISSTFFDFSIDVVINKALKKIRSHKNLLSIAIIGSYGVGTTKEFISQILKVKYNILEAKTSFNNASEIARTINGDLNPKKQIFVAAMEDNRFGDIREMCNVAIPKIIVVTGINNRNISMFGNMDKILSSKLEAIESLPKDGILLFSGNSDYSISLSKKSKKKKFVYSSLPALASESDIVAKDVKENKFTISFTIVTLGKEYKIDRLKLIGKQSVESLLPAIFIGLYLRIDFPIIRNIIRELRPFPGTMDPKLAPTGAVLIDDTYNVTLKSVLQALIYMKLYKGKKVLVMEPITELGRVANSEHMRLGEKIGEICDYLFLTNNNYKQSILKGIENVSGKCEVRTLPPAGISNFVNKNCKREDVVVFEGREAGRSLRLIDFESAY